MPRSISSVVAASLLASLVATGAQAGAQRISGVVLDSTARTPLGGAVVSILDAKGNATARTTADAAGHYSLARSATATQLRAIRIGYRPVTVSIPWTARDTTVELMLGRVPLLLSTVAVSDRELCPGSSDPGMAFVLWEQARAGLLAATVTRENNSAAATTALYRRRFSPAGALRGESHDRREGQTVKAFVAAADAATLARRGYMVEDSTGRAFSGPDEDVLLDESFAATHCFHLQIPDGAHGGQVGLAFEPVPGRDTIVDVTGVIWMNQSPLALRSLDFNFTSLEPAAMRAGAGGRIEFAVANNGAPFAATWSLRVPVLMFAAGATPTIMQSRLTTGRRGNVGVRLSEIEETSGEILKLTWADGTAFRPAPTGFSGQVLRDDGRGAAHALVTIDGEINATVADASGAFVVDALLPGHYAITVVDTALSAFAEPRSAGASVEVRRGELRPLVVRLPGLARAAAATCGQSKDDQASADMFGRLLLPPSATNSAKPRLVATARLAPDSMTADRYATIDDAGNFRLCGVKRHQPLVLRVRVASAEAELPVTVDESVMTSLVWRPALGVAVAAANAGSVVSTTVANDPPAAVSRIVRGVVVDSANRPLANVSVLIPGAPAVSTDAAGRFRISLPARDGAVIDVRRPGMMPSLYRLDAGTDTSLVVTMLPLVHELDVVNVTATSTRSALLMDFERRLKERDHSASTGTFITAADIEKRNPTLISAMFHQVPGVEVRRISTYEVGLFGIARSVPGASCHLTIYLNGMLIPDQNIDAIMRPGDVAGIEVYSGIGAAPTGYQTLAGGCPVVLIWLKG